ncbi:MAG: hypothetical protein IJF12_05400 [Alphaproteobacteria bacterium]|nr:hypothetical protein [Alphaproteobacteria bacterium]MBQ2811586.1 hypothetical protein [Alphaproteobacteria bacterium]
MQRQQDVILKLFVHTLLCFTVFAFLLTSELKAQMFDFDEMAESSSNELDEELKEKLPSFNNQMPRENALLRDKTIKNNIDSKKVDKINVEKVQEINPIDKDEKIYMYMRNFSVQRNINGRISCNMRFYLDSKVKEKITNISYRLKWPKIETALSFSNIEPEGQEHIDYTLYGKGCYEMDSAPNIIVNRCRIKGRTQEHCASIIKWSK